MIIILIGKEEPNENVLTVVASIQLHSQSDLSVPGLRDYSDVAGHDGDAERLLHSVELVMVAVKVLHKTHT